MTWDTMYPRVSTGRSLEKQLLREVSYVFTLGQTAAAVVRLPIASLLIFSQATPTLSHGEERHVVMGKPWVKQLGIWRKKSLLSIIPHFL
jgi:hypothetical protein